jgi:hypothetical protein
VVIKENAVDLHVGVFFRRGAMLAAVLAGMSLNANARGGVVLALAPSPAVFVTPGNTALFHVILKDYTGADPIIGFSLDLTASDAALTGGGTFSGFSFARSSALDGILTLEMPAAPGQFAFAADTFAPVPEAGITPALLAASGGQISLGTLSVLAPATPGHYNVVLTPGFGQTYLQLDNLDLTTVPPDGDLNVVNSAMEVRDGPQPSVPEPASVVVWLLVGAWAVMAWRRRRERGAK